MNTAVLLLPPCVCGHRYDHHTDPCDPRSVGCWRCACREYSTETFAERHRGFGSNVKPKKAR